MDIQISLTPELKSRAESLANASGLTLTEFVQKSIELAIETSDTADPLFSDDSVYRDDGPCDTATNHDVYLYGDAR